MDVRGDRFSVRGTLDPQELRYSLLFFDRLAWPTSNIVHVEGTPESKFLESASVLHRPRMTFRGSGGSEVAALAHYKAFELLDDASPGSWSLQVGENAFNWDARPPQVADALLLELVRAVPVPDKDVPLQEILEFKQRRHDVLLGFRTHIEEFVPSINGADDSAHAVLKSVRQIEKDCVELLRVGMEWKFPVRLTGLRAAVSMNTIDPGKVIEQIAKGFGGGWVMGLPDVGAIVGAAMAAGSMFKISPGAIGIERVKPQSTPYEYVYRFHDEVF